MKKILSLIMVVAVALTTVFFTGCNKTTEDLLEEAKVNLPDDKYNSYYQIWIGSFCDSNDDGYGDLQGIISQLDYINDGDDKTDTDLGYTGIWLSPMMPSPSYHKYDVKDYYNIDPQFGTLDDFDELIAECDKRGIDVIIDFVPNHCSKEHPWFKKALKEAEKGNFNGYAKYFNIEKSKDGEYSNGYNIDPDDPSIVYESNFSDTMPEWNYDYEGTKTEIAKAAKFWIDRGVAGFRLDAVRYLYFEDAERSSKVLKWFYDQCKEYKDDIYMVGEDWTGNMDEITTMYQSGLDSLFAFPFGDLTGKFTVSTLSGSINDLTDTLVSYEKTTKEANKDVINAYFLTNHDMMRVGDNLTELYQKKMAASLYMMTPGNTFTYYGEELGMETYDECNDPAKRTAMIWDSDNLPTKVTANGLDYVIDNTDGGGVKQQQENKESLLNFYKDCLKIRNCNPGIARGEISALPDSFDGGDGVGGYYLTYKEDKYLILHNIGTEKQSFEIKENLMSDYKIAGMLSAKQGNIKIDNNILTMPAYSTIVLHSSK